MSSTNQAPRLVRRRHIRVRRSASERSFADFPCVPHHLAIIILLLLTRLKLYLRRASAPRSGVWMRLDTVE